MNQEQAREMLELLRQINEALGRIEQMLAEEFGPPVGRQHYPYGDHHPYRIEDL